MKTPHPNEPAKGSKLDFQSYLAGDPAHNLPGLDAIAAELNAMTGSQIPMLGNLSLTELQTAITTYGDALKAVKFPPVDGTVPPAQHQAEMDLILAAQLTPLAARAIVNWSVDQATIEAFDKAKARPVLRW